MCPEPASHFMYGAPQLSTTTILSSFPASQAPLTLLSQVKHGYCVVDIGCENCGLEGVQVTDGSVQVAARDAIQTVINNYRMETNGSDMPLILASVPTFRKIHIATLGRATPGTGIWIRQWDTFCLWLNPDGVLRILWGSGMPGAGKTILASIVIDALEAHAATSASPICINYIYFRYTDHTKATIRDFLEILVKQTVERHSSCLQLFEEVYAQHNHERTQPSESELLGLLRKLTANMAASFYVLDALDEAPAAIRLYLVEKLVSLDVKIFITCRPMKNVEAHFPLAHCFPIIAQDHDLDLHIADEISRSEDLRAILEHEGQELRDHLTASVKEKCGGMFLHASLQLATLRECTSAHEVKETLVTFPANIDDLYRQTWGRIIAQTPSKALLARNSITWVVHATRPLTIEELRTAVATCPDTHTFSQDRLVQEHVLLGLCHGLVTVEQETRLVRLVHYTAKDTLERLIMETSPRPHSLLSAVCLARLTDSGLQRSALKSRDELRRALRAEHLLNYAYNSWFIHGRQSLDDPLTAVRLAEFIQNCHAFPVLYWSWPRGHCFDIFGPLHLVAYFKLPVAFAGPDHLQDQNQRSARQGETVLHLACMQGHDGAVEELLQLPSVLVNAAGMDGRTALILASSHGHEGAARLLLAHPDIDVNAVDHDGWTALIWASRRGHKGVVALLLSHPDINGNAADTVRSTALVMASEEGHEDTVALLLSHPDVDVNASTPSGNTALTKALTSGYNGIAKRLLAHPQVNVNVENMHGNTPLSRAAKNGAEDVVRLLLAHPSIHVGTRESKAAKDGGNQVIVSLIEEFLGQS